MVSIPQLCQLNHPIPPEKKNILLVQFDIFYWFRHTCNRVRHRRQPCCSLVLSQSYRADTFQPHISPPQRIYPQMIHRTISDIPSQHLRTSQPRDIQQTHPFFPKHQPTNFTNLHRQSSNLSWFFLYFTLLPFFTQKIHHTMNIRRAIPHGMHFPTSSRLRNVRSSLVWAHLRIVVPLLLCILIRHRTHGLTQLL